jgi:hypothetical protein
VSFECEEVLFGDGVIPCQQFSCCVFSTMLFSSDLLKTCLVSSSGMFEYMF